MLTAREILIYIAIQAKGDWNKIQSMIHQRPELDEDEVKSLVSQQKALTILDPEYPEQLKTIFQPPLVLFYEGDISLITSDTYKKTVAVIGTRHPTVYSEEEIIKIGEDISNHGLNIISGLALGVDRAAHIGALKGKSKTIAVIGCGLEYYYPKANKSLQKLIEQNGLVLSEYPKGTTPEPYYFVRRDRIVAGIASKILIVECGAKSGTMITAAFGNQFGRDVYACPVRINENAELVNNDLLADGALVYQKPEDLDDLQ